MSESDPGGPRRPSASRLFLLTALWPGLGHLAAGRRRWAAALGLPLLVPVVILAIVVVASVLTSSATSLAARLLDPQVLGALLVAEFAILLWRMFALGAVGVVRPLRVSGMSLVAAFIALAIIVGPQLYAASLTMDARDAATEVFQPDDNGTAWVPTVTAPPVASDDPDFETTATPTPTIEPSATPTGTPGVPRVNVLLIGIDSGVGRNTALTDTMIVASLDPVAKTVSMASIPRDMVDVPLPDGRSYRGKINSLVSYVRWHPSKFPGAKDGQSVLAAALGTLLGVKIDMWAQVNLGGFVNLVDSVGGVNVNVTDGFCDPRYKEYGINGFNITPGYYHFDGEHALAYARVRKAAGESDFTRQARQQEIIAALRDRMVKGAFLDNPSKFLKSLGGTIQTNIKPSFIADWIDVASQVQRKDVYRVVIGHPLVKGTYDARGSIQVPNIKAIRALAAKLFTPTGVRPAGFDTMPAAGSGKTRTASSSSTCGIKATPRPTTRPAPTPTPKPTGTAAPTAEPTPKPTAAPTAEPTPKPTAEPTLAPPEPTPTTAPAL